jgi:hypothetical protein
VSDQISQLNKTTGKIIFLCILLKLFICIHYKLCENLYVWPWEMTSIGYSNRGNVSKELVVGCRLHSSFCIQYVPGCNPNCETFNCIYVYFNHVRW